MHHMLGEMLGMRKELLARKPTGNRIIIMQCDSALVRSKPRVLWELRRGAPNSHRNMLIVFCKEAMLDTLFEHLPCFRYFAGG